MFESIVFHTQDLSDVPESNSWLSAGEREVFAGLHLPKRRNDWRLGRWTAKQAILEFSRFAPDTDLSLFEIRAAADGAPEAFLRNEPAEATISISHAGGRSFCAAGPPGAMLGCDIEQLEPRGQWTDDYFTSEEIELMRLTAPENKILVANLIWSAKESVLKALREGLRRDTRDISIRPDLPWIFHEDSAANPHEISGLMEPGNGWNRWAGCCMQTSREFRGRWRADFRFVYTATFKRQPPKTQ